MRKWRKRQEKHIIDMYEKAKRSASSPTGDQPQETDKKSLFR